MFCDEVTLRLIAGKGGSGGLSFRREKYVPYGGPDGGDGGNGGAIIFEVDNNVHTLAEYKSRKDFRAEDGQNGIKKNMHGRNGHNLILKVPPGTLVFEENGRRLIADLTEIGEKFTVVKGGRGGFGNAHFTSSTRKTPNFAEKGEPGEEIKVILELKMIAEVAIIGLPSAGKSTLIAQVSNARPKIADYPFTTLVPNLGVVNMDRFGGEKSQEFVVADVPGLIEGASEGKGLGHTFLKHVQRTKVLIHLVDGMLDDLPSRVREIESELKKYDPELAKRPTILAINKIDAIAAGDLKKEINTLKRKYKNREVFSVSAVTGDGIKSLLFAVWNQIAAKREEEMIIKNKEQPEQIKPQVIKILAEPDEKRVHVVQRADRDEKQVFQISGKRLEQIVIMSDLRNHEAMVRVYDVLKKMGLIKRLVSLGARDGDILQIGNDEIEFLELLD